ncbi:hypothetical protein SLS56_011864 [Neofusicoccum ribis]|uniref:Uncharacterized protein n=1 Tax=Neofusicoccum ribis TaxID=45134 RepID=A0ABR3SAH7_9PEZI
MESLHNRELELPMHDYVPDGGQVKSDLPERLALISRSKFTVSVARIYEVHGNFEPTTKGDTSLVVLKVAPRLADSKRCFKSLVITLVLKPSPERDGNEVPPFVKAYEPSQDGDIWLIEQITTVTKTRSVEASGNPTKRSSISDELVEKAILSQFKIEKFDWRKLDIDLSILTNSPHAEHFTDITLYSSGNWSVLYHRTSKDGLLKLKGLRKVRIEIMELNPLHDKTAHDDHAIAMKGHRKKLEQRLLGLKNRKKRENNINLGYEIQIEGKWDFRALQYQEDNDPFIPE